MRGRNMEEVYSELDSAKAEFEKLKAEYQIKTVLFESLKRAHREQLLKVEEAKLKIEKQSQELKVKNEEIAEAMQLSEKLESCLLEKELSLRNLGSLNEKSKSDIEKKLKTMEGENKELVSTLDEVITRNKELEQDVCANKKQIEGLKSLLLAAENKYFEAERAAQGAKELVHRDEVMAKLEEEKDNVQNKLKWKDEQFDHLEEALNKLQYKFQMSKEDWEREKSELLEETCSLQSRLDSQTKIVKDLQTSLEMCNNALTNEEVRRKSLEVQVSNFESRFQKFVAQFEEETSEIKRLTTERTEENSKLRNTLRTREILAKEMECQVVHLEQENQELLGLVKELQEEQIRNARTGSSEKILKKLRSLEQVHSRCSVKLKEKESELLSQIATIEKDLMSCKHGLEDKEAEIKKLQMELKSCCCTTEECNEELSIILAVLKSELSEAYSTAFNVKVELELLNKEKDDKISLLIAQLEMSRSALETTSLELEEERKKDRKLEQLLQQIVVLEGKSAAKDYEREADVEVIEHIPQILKEKETCIEILQKDIAMLKQESRRRELEAATLARFDAERDFTEEKERLLRIITDKEQKLKNLKILATSLEKDFTTAIILSFSDVIENHVKINALTEALEKYKYATDLEIEEKNRLITRLKKEDFGLHQRLTQQEKSFLLLKQEVEQLQSLLHSNQLETEKSMDGQRKMEAILKQLQSDKEHLLQDNTKLYVERQSLLSYLQNVCDGLREFSSEDVEMMGTLAKLLPRSEENIETTMDLIVTKKLEAHSTKRSPLKDINL